jgi:hypothetical protein
MPYSTRSLSAIASHVSWSLRHFRISSRCFQRGERYALGFSLIYEAAVFRMSKGYSRLFSEYFATVHDDSTVIPILNGTTRKRFRGWNRPRRRGQQPGDLDEYQQTHRKHQNSQFNSGSTEKYFINAQIHSVHIMIPKDVSVSLVLQPQFAKYGWDPTEARKHSPSLDRAMISIENM